MQSIDVDTSECLPKCEGMEIISYDEYEENSALQLFLNKKFGTTFGNAVLKWDLLELANQYSNYKENFQFTTKDKSKYN